MRITFLYCAAVFLLMAGRPFGQSVGAQYWSAQSPPPVSGEDNPDLASFDRLMINFLIANQVPGASLAVSRHGRLVYARGFGWADYAKRQPMQPGSLFRIASITKPFTAVAIMRLAQDGKIQLDSPAFEQMPFQPRILPGMVPEPRLRSVTILELLQHRGGWDRDISFDPMFKSIEIAERARINPPANPENIIDYMLGVRLDFPPGQRYAYSNFGYCVLGRVIEKAARSSYEDYVNRVVLQPLGITDMRLGRTHLADRAPREVHYYDPTGQTYRSIFPDDRGAYVPEAYGAWDLEAMDSHGRWLASAPDLVRLAMAFDNLDHSPLLNPEMAKMMFQRPSGLAGFDSSGNPLAFFYACGWEVRPVGRSGAFNAWHMGLLTGCCSTLLVRRYDGTDWAVLFNTDRNRRGEVLAGKIDPLVHHAANEVTRWPVENAALH